MHFNPHEREARDTSRMYTSVQAEHFNPHEREARD